jgi:hypothetical protein
VLQRVREDGDKTGVARGFPCEVFSFLFTGEEYGLRSQRAAIRLDPIPSDPIKGSMPHAHALCGQGRVRYFEHDAAHILFGEEIFSGELEVVEGAERVEEKGIAAPAREESVIP